MNKCFPIPGKELQLLYHDMMSSSLLLAKNTSVFLLDEIPRSTSVESRTLRGRDCYGKWTFLKIVDCRKGDLKTIHSLIVQGKTPILRRVDDKGQYLWLVRKRDFDAWIEKYRKSQEI